MSDYKKLIQLLSDAQTIAEANIENAHNIDLEDLAYTLEKMQISLNKIKQFETYSDDEGPEYDSAGFTDEDRVVDGEYRVIDFDMEAQDYDVFGNNKI
jgi:hypothetical protein